MKFMAALLLLVGFTTNKVVLIHGQENDCGFISMLQIQAIVQCLDVHQISREAVEGFLSHEFVLDDREVKCWIGCVLTKLVVIKEGRMDWEYFKHIIKHCLSDGKDKAKVDKLIMKCKAEVPQGHKDVCELAYSAAVCKINSWKELGLP